MEELIAKDQLSNGWTVRPVLKVKLLQRLDASVRRTPAWIYNMLHLNTSAS